MDLLPLIFVLGGRIKKFLTFVKAAVALVLQGGTVSRRLTSTMTGLTFASLPARR
jgi:hypothetical protein